MLPRAGAGQVDVEQRGLISMEDFKQILLRSLRSRQFRHEDITEIFSYCDIDSTGELSYTDFTAAAMSLCVSSDGRESRACLRSPGRT